ALDVLAQLAVLDRDKTVPPSGAAVGDRHIVPSGASLAWAGKAGQIAVRGASDWRFYAPLPGWRAQVLAEGQLAVFDGSAWKTAAEGPFVASQIGVSATPDAVNRLSVNAPATLLNHAGGGH